MTVLCVGVATVDTIVLVDQYPAANERVVARKTIRAIGGPATTAAVTLARLGVDVALSCVIGEDAAGDEVVTRLKSEGVDTRNVIVDKSVSTALGTIVVSASEQTRAIMVQPHASLPTKPSNMSDYQWIHVDQAGMDAIAQWGIKRGGSQKLSIDIGYPKPNLHSSDWDLYVPSEYVTTDVTSAALDKNLVVVSRGSEGSIFSDGKESGVIPAISTEVVSTLGAGDVFHGALVAAQVWGKSLRESVEIANVVAGISCRGLDGQSGIPTKTELDAYRAGVRI